MKHSSTVPGRLGLDSFRKNRMCGIYYDTHNRIPRNLKFCEKMTIRLFDLLTINEFKVMFKWIDFAAVFPHCGILSLL